MGILAQILPHRSLQTITPAIPDQHRAILVTQVRHRRARPRRFPSCTQVVSVSSSTTITSTSCTTITGCSGTGTTGVSTASASSTGVYCSIGCAGCGPASKLKSKRDPPLTVEGRLATPKDYWRDHVAKSHSLASLPASYTDVDKWKRGYIPQLTNSDFAKNVNNFVVEQIGFVSWSTTVVYKLSELVCDSSHGGFRRAPGRGQ